MKNLAFFSIALAFLMDISGRMSKQLQADLASANTTLDDQVLELKKEISGGSTIDLLDATDERIDGINSFDKNTLKTGRAFIFDQISLGYATNAAPGLAGNIEYNTKAPKELQNAILIISQEGREVLRMPVRDIHNIYTATNESEEYKQLKSLRYLKDEATIEIKLKFPPSVALSDAAKHYVYLRLNGAQTTKKA